MQNYVSILSVSSIFLSLATVFAPSSAMAASAWSSVTINQQQNVSSWVPVEMSQEATSSSWVAVDDAEASSQALGRQEMITQEGEQNQIIQTGAGLEWGCDEDNNCGYYGYGEEDASGETYSRVGQEQDAFSYYPGYMTEEAASSEEIWFDGEQAASNEAYAQQMSDFKYEAGQAQSIIGSSQADGTIGYLQMCDNEDGYDDNNYGYGCEDIGATIEQFVTVTVRSIFQY